MSEKKKLCWICEMNESGRNICWHSNFKLLLKTTKKTKKKLNWKYSNASLLFYRSCVITRVVKMHVDTNTYAAGKFLVFFAFVFHSFYSDGYLFHCFKWKWIICFVELFFSSVFVVHLIHFAQFTHHFSLEMLSRCCYIYEVDLRILSPTFRRHCQCNYSNSSKLDSECEQGAK